ncbi:MAG: hypothetical protein JSU96_09130 [Acidobacteriota bacterium]|nr:MAG: hypothetical protein JSU96_09130 [Acidobacteriota bacterium]
MRYRKVFLRIENDEKVRELNPLEELLWRTLISHPMMTPMGAGVIDIAVLDRKIGNAIGSCFRCDGECIDPVNHSADGALEKMERAGMILRDGDLVILKNFLIYNRPDNQKQLAGWIGAIEELPRSDAFRELRDHLLEVNEDLGELPHWLFACLLDPLAEGRMRGLKRLFWEREQGPSGDGGQEPPAKENPPTPDVEDGMLMKIPDGMFENFRVMNTGGFSQPEKLTRSRRDKCLARVRSAQQDKSLGKEKQERLEAFLSRWGEAITRGLLSDFLTGGGSRGWKASFDWFVANDENYLKVLEGRYDDSRFGGQTETTRANMEAVSRFLEN